MEDHEKKMKNLLCTLTDYGGICNDTQFCLILVASLSLDWKQDTRNVPGTSSEDAFMFLHSLYLEKQQERESSERDEKHVKALMAKQSTLVAATDTQQRNHDLLCSNCSKHGHTHPQCWSKGGGAEGEAPKNWRFRKPNNPNSNPNPNSGNVNAALVAADPEPSQLYVLSTDPMGGSPIPIPIAGPDTLPSRHEPSLVIERSNESDGLAGICRDLPIHCNLVPNVINCSLCHGNTRELPKTYIDSGATEHCWMSKDDFIMFTEIRGQKGSSAVAGDAGQFDIWGIGTVQFKTRDGGKPKIIWPKNMKYIPSFNQNLILLSAMDSRQCKGNWGDGMLEV